MSVAPGIDTQYFSVLTDLNFKPSVWVPTNDLAQNLAGADVDGDGRSDLLVSQGTRLEVFFGEIQPDLYGPVVLAGSTGGPVAVGT